MELDFLSMAPDTMLLPNGHHTCDEYADVDTMGDLLVRLGHRCRGECPDEPFSLTGLIGVIPRRQLPGSVALVLVDLNQRPEPLVELFRVPLAINDCVRPDRIRVLPGDGVGE